MSYLLLHIYPAFKSVEWLESEAKDIQIGTHWMSFWMMSFLINQMTFLPNWIQWPSIALMYFPETTDFCRKTFVSEVAPHLRTVAGKGQQFLSDKLNTLKNAQEQSGNSWLSYIPYLSKRNE